MVKTNGRKRCGKKRDCSFLFAFSRVNNVIKRFVIAEKTAKNATFCVIILLLANLSPATHTPYFYTHKSAFPLLCICPAKVE